MKYFYEDVIDGRSIDLNEYLKILFNNPNKVFPNNCFPSNKHLDEYVMNIADRSEEEVKRLIDTFIVHEGTYDLDLLYFELMQKDPIYFQNVKKTKGQYLKRLVFGKDAWEGISWVLDLLPGYPREAINVINSFFMAYCAMLPDNVINGLLNINELIRAKFFNYEHPMEVLHNLTPSEFEALVAELFNKMGYSVELTGKSYDGGIDIIIEKSTPSQKELSLVQCKKYKKTIGVKDIRELLGVVENKKATRSIFCTCSDYTKMATHFCKSNSRIELMSGTQIIKLCNEYFGSNWPTKIDIYMYKNTKNS